MDGTENVTDRVPVVIVDDLHVKYRVFASGRAARRTKTGSLSRTQGGVRYVHALKGVSFTAYQNESIGVIGANGSGKSTLMRAIVGLTPALGRSVRQFAAEPARRRCCADAQPFR